jgi:uncharacterized membrane protein
MIDSLLVVLTFLSALGSGLMAGVFFAFSTFVMKALSRLPAGEGIAAMQSINVVAVLSSGFMIAFFGTAAACAVLAIASFFSWDEASVIYLFAGGLLYLIGVFMVTIAFNVPLNKALKAAEPNSGKGTRVWTHYMISWTHWNHVRTVAALAALALFIIALR